MEDSSEHAVVVKFRSTGKDFDYNFDPAQLTVRQLKEKLTTQTSIPADSMRLVYSGRVLKDEDTVELYGKLLIVIIMAATGWHRVASCFFFMELVT